MPSLGKTAARGYGSPHQRERAKYQRRMDAGEVFICTKPRCGRVINPAHWDLAHHPLDRSVYLGPQCVPCNRDSSLEKRRARAKVTRRSRQW